MPPNPINKTTQTCLQGTADSSHIRTTNPARNVFQLAIHGLAELLQKAGGSLQSCSIKNCLSPSQGASQQGLLLSLDNAIETDDFSAVKTFLDAGSRVATDAFDNASPAMKSFILFSGRVQKLYPNPQSMANLDALDHALLACCNQPEAYKERFMNALELLHNEMGSQSNAIAWRTAVNDGHLSVQKAILLLKPLRQISLILKDRDKVSDPGVKAVMKEIPYHPPRHNKAVKINGVAKFLRSRNPIQCRHITMHRLMRQAMHADGKFRLSESQETYSRAVDASQNIPEEIDRQYVNLVTKAPQLHLIDVSFAGRAIARQFSDMSPDSSPKLFLIQAHNHAMSLGLIVKQVDQKPCYVLDFFDPNLAPTHVRMAADNVDTFKSIKLSDLIHRSVYRSYFPDDSHLALMTKAPDNLHEFVNNPDQSPSQPRSLESLTLASQESLLEPEAIYYLLQAGLGSEIRQLGAALISQPYAERMRSLEARSTKDVPGFHAALQDGYADTVRAFGEILIHLQNHSYPQDLIDLVSAQRWDKVPGFYFAVQNGHVDAVKEYIQLVYTLNLPIQTKLALLNPVNSKGFSARHAAIKNGHREVADLVDQALRTLDPRGIERETGLTKINQNRLAR